MNRFLQTIRRNKNSILLFVAGLGLASAAFSIVTLVTVSGTVQAKDNYTTNVSMNQLQAVQASFRDVASATLPTVVEVNTINRVTQRVPNIRNPFRFFNLPFQQQDPEEGEDDNDESFREREFEQQGLGSGVIVRRAGKRVYVLTNAHVVEAADEINLTLYDGREFTAELVGKDERQDLALIFFETNEDIPIAKIGDSDALMPGDWVIAVGNPLGFESTVTAGIVSAVGRQSEQGGFTDYIQTDAAINQGNSGGALMNIYGEVVGINSWIASRSGGSIGLGFAIPSNVANSAIEDFIERGQIQYGWLGVSMGIVPEEFIGDRRQNTAGAFIASVFQGSPADKGGIKPGDTIVKVNGTDIGNRSDLVLAISNIRPGSTADVVIERNGRSIPMAVKITTRGEDSDIALATEWPGLLLLPVTEQVKEQMNLSSKTGNIVVADVDDSSPASKAGVESGDIIQEVNGKKVRTVDDFYEALNGASGRNIDLKLYRQDEEIELKLKR